jgi:FMN reductase
MSGPHLILSCSLRPGSHSAILARALAGHFRAQGEPVELLDLREIDLPFCDDDACYSHVNVVRLREAIAVARSITLAVPIYNFDVGGAARNLVAVAGREWRGKVVGFLCAAGGGASYMSVMALANSLMLDFRCVIVPRFVYATRAAFDEGSLKDTAVDSRLDELARELERFAEALTSEPVVRA